MISIIEDRTLKYPEQADSYSPDEHFPEYQYLHISSISNPVYRAVRACLAQAGLDRNNFGTPSWNPLRYAIAEGSSVFVLCNFVYHKRPHEKLPDFYAKCTHGSVLRAFLDYVLLAVGKKGTVRFGNAPIQSCDWARVLEETGTARVAEFYRQFHNSVVAACDLRSHVIRTRAFGAVTPVSTEDKHSEIEVDLGKDSLLEEFYQAGNTPMFRILDYDPQQTKRYHARGRHVYVLNKAILEADVIVSIPKLKTHEKVGTTLGIKGCVGGIAHKHCLAHYRLGSPCKEGDEYQNSEFLNWIESTLGEFVNARPKSLFTDYLRKVDFILRKFIIRVLGNNVGGGWFGNDTAWRMALDIARIVTYADKSGKLCNAPQRVHLSLIDGIVGGEGNGPLSPKPVNSGVLIFSDNLAAGDRVACRLMGYNPSIIPIVKQAFRQTKYPLCQNEINHRMVIYKGAEVTEADLQPVVDRPFLPPNGWRKYLEVADE
jgi:uncharacterized protein (DUF362 family)